MRVRTKRHRAAAFVESGTTLVVSSNNTQVYESVRSDVTIGVLSIGDPVVAAGPPECVPWGHMVPIMFPMSGVVLLSTLWGVEVRNSLAKLSAEPASDTVADSQVGSSVASRLARSRDDATEADVLLQKETTPSSKRHPWSLLVDESTMAPQLTRHHSSS